MIKNLNYFVIIGAQRSGSTFLYNLLDAHPEIEMNKPVKPEPKFYIDKTNFSLGKDYYLNNFFSEFRINNKIKAIGEKSTSYIEFEDVAEKINTLFPDSKVLVILRNPVSRAISNYMFSVKNGIEKRPVNEVFCEKYQTPLKPENLSVNPFAYIERGYYSNYLEPYLKVFGDRMKILIFEEIIASSIVQNELYSFLGVSDFSFDTSMLNRNESEYKWTSEEEKLQVESMLEKAYLNEIPKIENLLQREIKIWKVK